jgi:hypothetical protein
VQNIAIEWQINLIRRPDDDICIVWIVFFKVQEKVQDLFSNTEVFVGGGISRTGFLNNQDIKLFREMGKSQAKMGDVLRECDDVTTHFVLTALAHPHEEAR